MATRFGLGLVLLAAEGTVLLGSCRRETRRLQESPLAGARAEGVRVGQLQPGPKPVAPEVPDNSTAYEANAYAISEGQRLYSWFNCVGCHAHGGGAIGPPLMDDIWIYGSDPRQIFASIVEGRPNGMPAFRGKIADYQVWQIVAYVRSLGGLEPKAATPTRDDHLEPKRGKSP
jgi:cytochrome c oxidase cbb3-type subunit 3